MLWRRVDVAQGTEEWFQARLGKITSSKAGIWMQGDEFSDKAKTYALEVSLERLTGERQEPAFVSMAMKQGIDMEPFAREMYQDRFFVEVSDGGFYETEDGRIGDSPDGILDGGTIEIKCPSVTTHLANLKRMVGKRAMKHDPQYHWQILSHIEATGSEWCDFISYNQSFPEQSRIGVTRVYAEDYLEDMKKLIETRYKFLEYIDSIELFLKGYS